MGADGSLPTQPGAMRGHLIRALERRANGLRGSARRRVEERLSALKIIAEPTGEANRKPASQGAFGELLDHLARSSSSLDKGPQDDRLPLAVLDEARRLWAKLRTEGQVREALAAEPAGAGPLNSARLAHRSLHLMRELSPDYLQHFLAYADALSWLEEFDAAAPKPKAAGKLKATRKAAPRR